MLEAKFMGETTQKIQFTCGRWSSTAISYNKTGLTRSHKPKHTCIVHLSTCPMQVKCHPALSYTVYLETIGPFLPGCMVTASCTHGIISNSHCSKCWWEVTAWFVFYENICTGVLLNQGPVGARLQKRMVSVKHLKFFLLKHLYNDHLPLSQKLSPVTSALKEIFILKCTAKEKIFTGNLQWGTRAPQCSSGRWAYDAFVQSLNLPLSFKKAGNFSLTIAWFCSLLKKAELTRKRNRLNIFPNLSSWWPILKTPLFHIFHIYDGYWNYRIIELLGWKWPWRSMLRHLADLPGLPGTKFTIWVKNLNSWRLTQAAVASTQTPAGNTDRREGENDGVDALGTEYVGCWKKIGHWVWEDRKKTNKDIKMVLFFGCSCNEWLWDVQKTDHPHLVTPREVRRDSPPGVVWLQMPFLPKLIFQCLQLQRNL